MISLTNDSRYLGFWWPSGSPENTLKFYNGSTLLLTVTTSDIISLLGTAPANNTAWQSQQDVNNPAHVITSIDGIKHLKAWYFGNPRGYTSIPPLDWAEAGSRPVGISSWSSSQPFVYVHMFADGNLTFNAVELSGQGFEFDNLAVSTTAQTPNQRLVRVGEPIVSSQKAVLFEANGAGVQGTMPSQIGTTSAALSTNAFERTGFTFAGWATEEDGGGTRFADGASYDFAADLTLYARWTPDPQPSSDGDEPAVVTTERTLAATGINQSVLLAIPALVLIVGLSLLAGARRLRRT
jgi:uncharacterized repeat protein (TIGR02543 family)